MQLSFKTKKRTRKQALFFDLLCTNKKHFLFSTNKRKLRKGENKKELKKENKKIETKKTEKKRKKTAYLYQVKLLLFFSKIVWLHNSKTKTEKKVKKRIKKTQKMIAKQGIEIVLIKNVTWKQNSQNKN